MNKSAALMNKMQSFSDKLSGTSRINNANNPGSAVSMVRRKQTNMPNKLPNGINFGTQQKTYGVPGAQ